MILWHHQNIKMSLLLHIVHATINAFYLWSQCHVLKLTKNLRLQSNSDTTHAIEVTNFAKWILQIGDGTLG